MIKNLILIVLVAIVVGLCYFILQGSFCECSTIYCPRQINIYKGFYG